MTDPSGYMDIVDHLLGGGKTWQTDFWERPLTFREFCVHKDHLRNVKLSDHQLTKLEEFLGTDPVMVFDKASKRPNLCTFAWGKGCQLETARITLLDGTVKTIAELIAAGEAPMVLALNEEQTEVIPAQSSVPFWRGKGECVEVRTASGRVFRVFGGHLFLSAHREVWRRNQNRNNHDRQGRDWKSANELSVGDVIALPASIPVNGLVSEPEVARYIGYILGDGAASDKDCTPQIKGENIPGIIQDIRKTVRAVSGRPASEWPDRNCTWFGSGFLPWETRRGENALYEVAKTYGLLGKNAYTKVVPEQCFRFDTNSTWELLSGLWMTDGWVCPVLTSKSNGRRTWEVGYGSQSERLIRDIAELLHRQGIVARIGKKNGTYNGKPYVSWTLKLRERVMLMKFLNGIRLVGPKGDRVKEAVEEYRGLPLGVPRGQDGAVYWDRIVSITPIGVHDYYDLEVEGPENYVAEGGLHHNSGKNMVTTLIQQYLLYILLMMRDPLRYFGFPHGESIDMLNVASSAAQAQKNFFNKFTRRIKTWRWLRQHFIIVQHGKPIANPEKNRGIIRITDDSVAWDGGVQCISAHSDSKGYEGYSPVFWVMDEASSWATEYITGENGEQIAVSRAHSIFDTLRTSSVSRSWKWAGMIISYPRNEDDFTLSMAEAIQKGEIKDAVADIAATWEVKPRHMWVSQETFEHKVVRPWGTFFIYPPKDFEEEFRLHPSQSELKYACVPTRTNAYFIANNEKIRECAVEIPTLVTLRPVEFVVPVAEGDQTTERYIGHDIVSVIDNPPYHGDYFVHIDLSVNSDTTTLAIGHAEPFNAQVMIQEEGGMVLTPLTHRVVIDQIISWEPSPGRLVSTINVDDILERLDAKLRFRYISLDQFESAHTLEKLAVRGKKSGKHNVRNQEYFLLRSLIYANAISYPKDPKIIEELEKLVWNGKRVDHTRLTGKDRADSIAGVARSIFLKRGKRLQRIKFTFSG